MHAPSREGFTLIELSIVLVIIGLIVGGVLVGRDLIKSATLRSITVQQQRFVTAINTFRDKYSALPGDMQNATTYWGTATACPGNLSSSSFTAATCNGNADGRVQDLFIGSGENFRMWQQLANTGLIEGRYTGISGDDSYWWNQTLSNSPEGKIPNSVWSVANWDNSAGAFTSQIAYIHFGNMLLLGGTITGTWNYKAILSASDVFNIDSKIDDGVPNTGKVMVSLFTPCSNTANGGVSPAAYQITSTSVSCIIYFPNAF